MMSQENETFSLAPVTAIPVIITIGLSVYNVASQSAEISAYQYGQLTGQAFAIVLFPTILAWIGWRLSRRSNIVKYFVFGFVLGFFFLAHTATAIVQLPSKPRQETTLITPEIDASSPGAPSLDFSPNLRFQPTEQIQGTIQAFQQTLADYRREDTTLEDNFVNAHKKFIHSDSDNFEQLRDQKSMDAALNAAHAYTSAAGNYAAFHVNAREFVRESMHQHGVNDDEGQGFLDMFNRNLELVAPLSGAIYQTHVEYGGSKVNLLTLLSTHHDEWIVTAQGVRFSNETLSNEYRAIAKNVAAQQNRMKTELPRLAQQLANARQALADEASESIEESESNYVYPTGKHSTIPE